MLNFQLNIDLQLCNMHANIQTHMYGRRSGRVDWSLGIQRCGRGFETQCQWMRPAIITEAVFRSFLITRGGFFGVLPFPPPTKKLQRSKFENGNNMRGPTICTPSITA